MIIKYIFYLLLFASIFTIIVLIQDIREHKKKLRKFYEMSILGIKPKTKKINKYNSKINSWFNILKNDNVKYKIASAGNPKYIGETETHFYVSKIICAAIVGIIVGKSGIAVLITGTLGFFFPDFLIYLYAKNRKEEIIHQLPGMIDFLRKSLINGMMFDKTFASLTERVSGPLVEEVKRLSVRYNLTLDLDESLNEFARRIDLEEVDNLVLALTQSEKTGKVKELLTLQSSILKTKLEYEVRKNNDTKSNLLPLVSILMVGNILILVIAPLMISIFQNDFF